MKDTSILVNNGVDVNAGLALLGDMEMYDSMMQEFLSGFNDRMAKIKQYREMPDMLNYSIEVHSLKSDSKYLGFSKLAELAYYHEMHSKTNDIDNVNIHYDELVSEANRIVALIKQYLGIGEGTTVTLKAQTPVVNIISPKEVSMMTKSILVADDSSIIRDFVSEIFSSKYSVIVASNGEEVLNVLKSNSDNIAALLLDLNMPGTDGFGVLEYMKENNLFATIPTSIISGASDKESIDKAFTYPIIDMLNKPFTKESVKLVVEKTIGLD